LVNYITYYEIRRKDSYFKSQEKYNKPICTIYIDAHGIESTTEKSCKSGAAKVFSFGVSGAVAYAKKYEKNGHRNVRFLKITDINDRFQNSQYEL